MATMSNRFGKVVMKELYYSDNFSTLFEDRVRSLLPPDREIVIACIGSDRYTGDCLAPLVGTYLEQKGVSNVYGTVDYPIHAGNWKERMDNIYTQYSNPFIIAIDAAMQKFEKFREGQIEVSNGGMKIGIAVGNAKEAPMIGDISITGLVQFEGYTKQQSATLLSNVRLSLVMKMANAITNSLVKVVRQGNEDKLRLVRGMK